LKVALTNHHKTNQTIVGLYQNAIKWFFKEFYIKLIHPCGNTIYIVMLDMIDGNQHFAIVVYAIQLINMYDIIIINMSVNFHEDPEKTIDMSQVTDKLNHIMLYTSP
jgi:hypothetical protein